LQENAFLDALRCELDAKECKDIGNGFLDVLGRCDNFIGPLAELKSAIAITSLVSVFKRGEVIVRDRILHFAQIANIRVALVRELEEWVHIGFTSLASNRLS
jgi:hypothetical protein